MILHITTTRVIIIITSNTLKFLKYNLHRFLYHICQNVETTSMGHTDHDVAHTSSVHTSLHTFHNSRNHRVTTFKSKTLCSIEFCGQESLELIRSCQTLQRVQGHFFGRNILYLCSRVCVRVCVCSSACVRFECTLQPFVSERVI